MKYTILSGLLAVSGMTAQAEPVRIDVIDTPHSGWAFHRLNLKQTDNNTIVSGRINAPVTSFRPASGHIDLAVYSSDGKRLAETTARYTPAQLSPRTQRKGGARFYAELPRDLPAGSIVKVAFHANEGTLLSSAPAHARTIAE